MTLKDNKLVLCEFYFAGASTRPNGRAELDAIEINLPFSFFRNHCPIVNDQTEFVQLTLGYAKTKLKHFTVPSME